MLRYTQQLLTQAQAVANSALYQSDVDEFSANLHQKYGAQASEHQAGNSEDETNEPAESNRPRTPEDILMSDVNVYEQMYLDLEVECAKISGNYEELAEKYKEVSEKYKEVYGKFKSVSEKYKEFYGKYEEVYEKLKNVARPDEKFADVVNRLSRGKESDDRKNLERLNRKLLTEKKTLETLNEEMLKKHSLLRNEISNNHTQVGQLRDRNSKLTYENENLQRHIDRQKKEIESLKEQVARMNEEKLSLRLQIRSELGLCSDLGKKHFKECLLVVYSFLLDHVESDLFEPEIIKDFHVKFFERVGSLVDLIKDEQPTNEKGDTGLSSFCKDLLKVVFKVSCGKPKSYPSKISSSVQRMVLQALLISMFLPIFQPTANLVLQSAGSLSSDFRKILDKSHYSYHSRQLWAAFQLKYKRGELDTDVFDAIRLQGINFTETVSAFCTALGLDVSDDVKEVIGEVYRNCFEVKLKLLATGLEIYYFQLPEMIAKVFEREFVLTEGNILENSELQNRPPQSEELYKNGKNYRTIAENNLSLFLTGETPPERLNLEEMKLSDRCVRPGDDDDFDDDRVPDERDMFFRFTVFPGLRSILNGRIAKPSIVFAEFPQPM
ncbi:hypothetical protein HK098_001376 [Nowakowskiella sp. JEL0407]|nr:hypothetical protein HK098_001376 [Nowakowskiella sp. JEL0407]